MSSAVDLCAGPETRFGRQRRLSRIQQAVLRIYKKLGIICSRILLAVHVSKRHMCDYNTHCGYSRLRMRNGLGGGRFSENEQINWYPIHSKNCIHNRSTQPESLVDQFNYMLNGRPGDACGLTLQWACRPSSRLRPARVHLMQYQGSVF